MHPYLFRAGPFLLTCYSVMLALAYLSGTLLAAHRARQRGLDGGWFHQLALLVMVAALAGSRLWFVMLHWGYYAEMPWEAVQVYRNGMFQLSGLAMNGGVMAAIGVAIGAARHARLGVWGVLDVLAPSFVLGMGLTRIGCFLNGCCYGLPTTLPWGVHFAASSPAGLHQRLHQTGFPALHPAQLYSAIGALLILVVVLAVERGRRLPAGLVTMLVLGMYGMERAIVDEFRYYPESAYWGGLTHNQVVSVGLVVFSLGAGMMMGRGRKWVADGAGVR